MQPEKPAPPVKQKKEGKEIHSSKCQVTVDITIHSILDISETDSVMELAFELSMSWLDPRMNFYNLKKNIALNILTKEEKMKIWSPILGRIF